MTADAAARQVDVRGRDGIRLRADVVGDRGSPAVVLLHGGGQTRHSWGATARALAETGWLAYAVDLRGHGESEWAADGDYSLDAFAGDVAAVALQFPEPPALVGASLGGVASLLAVGESEGPLASSLVLVDVAPRIEPSGAQRVGDFMRANLSEGFGSLEEVADAVAAYNPHRPRPSDLSGLQRNVRLRPDGRWTWHWDPAFMAWQDRADVTRPRVLLDPDRLEAAARRVEVPMLLVRGRMSDLLSEAGAHELLELVGHAEFADVEGAGHMVAGDRNDPFNAAVTSFLARHRPLTPS
ncbi:MAG TPA: alpha/beta hydrolase [Acidimicrobiales bacterium]